MKISSFANQANAELIDRYYQQWQQNPEETDADWRAFFEGFELARSRNGAVAKTPDRAEKEARVASLVYAYRSLGHNAAHLDPLPDDRGDRQVGGPRTAGDGLPDPSPRASIPNTLRIRNRRVRGGPPCEYRRRAHALRPAAARRGRAERTD